MRPLSPHLQIHKPVLTMIFSITHRIAGIIYSSSLLFFALWIGSAVMFEKLFQAISIFMATLLFKLLLIIWFFCINHHILNGIKYFFWTFLKGMELRSVYTISYFIIGINLAMTVFFGKMVI